MNMLNHLGETGVVGPNPMWVFLLLYHNVRLGPYIVFFTPYMGDKNAITSLWDWSHVFEVRHMLLARWSASVTVHKME